VGGGIMRLQRFVPIFLRNIVISSFFILFSSGSVFADDDVNARLEALEEELLELQLKQSEKAPVTAFDAIRLDFGGFITQTFTSTFNGGSPSKASFDQTNLEFLIGADVTERDSVFVAVGFLRQSDLLSENTGTDVRDRVFAKNANRVPGIIMWGKHRFSDLLDVTYGRFIDPWGIINIEHFPPVLLNLNQPQFLRNVNPGNLFGSNTFVPNFLNGVQAHGAKFFGNNQLQYYGYTSNFNGEGSSDFISGGRLSWTFPDNIATLGTSYQNGVRDESTRDHYDAFGVDLLVNYKNFLLKSEYIQESISGASDRESWYIQPSYRHNKFIFFYRYDYIDLDTDIESDSTEQTEHVFGLNYVYTPTIRLRAEYVVNDFELEKDSLGQERDYDNIQASITISF
jgi:hypothetical protein